MDPRLIISLSFSFICFQSEFAATYLKNKGEGDVGRRQEDGEGNVESIKHGRVEERENLSRGDQHYNGVVPLVGVFLP